MYRAEGDPNFASVGETEFVNGIAAMSATASTDRRACAPASLASPISCSAHKSMRSWKHICASAATVSKACAIARCGTPTSRSSLHQWIFRKGLLLDPQFRAGFARLERYRLSFDAFLYHPQIPELADLARTFPDTTIVLNHIGSPLGMASMPADATRCLKIGSVTLTISPSA